VKLLPWRLSGGLTATRTRGQIGLRRNGTQIDIWIRVDGEPQWFSVNARDLGAALGAGEEQSLLAAESDGNAE
jgi:hypothetical protein